MCSDNTLDHTEPVTATAPADDEPLVELRCALAVFHGDRVLLVQRPDRGDWVLPGGRPHSHESMAACARRESREEAGLDVHPNRCGLILEVNDPN